MLNRNEAESLISANDNGVTTSDQQIQSIQANADFAKRMADGADKFKPVQGGYVYGYLAGGEVVLGAFTASTADFLLGSAIFMGSTVPVLALTTGAVYGVGYHFRTQEKHYIVERLIREINAAQTMNAFFAKAEEIDQTHAPYLRKERGTYGLTLVQKFVGNKLGHETGNTKSWIEIVNALENRCKALANAGELDDSLRRLHDITARATADPPAEAPRPK